MEQMFSVLLYTWIVWTVKSESLNVNPLQKRELLFTEWSV